MKKVNKHADPEGFVESIARTRKSKNGRRSTGRGVRRRMKGLWPSLCLHPLVRSMKVHVTLFRFDYLLQKSSS